MRKLLILVCLAILASCGTSKSSTYVIGIDPQWYPLELLGIEDNVLAFSIELLVEISKREKLPLAMITKSWDNLVEDLDKKQYDAMLSSMQPYTFFEKTYSFSNLYLKTGPVVVVPKTSKIRSAEDLQSKEVGVVIGSTSTILLQKIPGIILQSFTSIPLTLEGIRLEKVQAGAVPILVAQRFVTDLYANVLRITTPPLDDEGLRLITLHKAQPKLLDRFNRGLMKLKKEGTYDKLLAKWGLAPNSPRPSPKVTQAFIDHHLKK